MSLRLFERDAKELFSLAFCSENAMWAWLA